MDMDDVILEMEKDVVMVEKKLILTARNADGTVLPPDALKKWHKAWTKHVLTPKKKISELRSAHANVKLRAQHNNV